MPDQTSNAPAALAASLKQFPQIAAAAFQHPLDAQALKGLRSVPYADRIIKQMSASVFERQSRLAFISQCVRIGPTQGPRIYQKFQEAAAILDLDVIPEIFVSTGSEVNAFAIGMEKYQIVLFSGLIEIMDEAELLAVIGHELDHIKCRHMLYNTMARLLSTVGLALLDRYTPFGLGKHLMEPMAYALLEWQRKAEYSCDRAALLVVQDPDVVAKMLTKLAGGSRRVLPELNIAAIREQADDYDEGDDGWMDKLLKIKMLMSQTHPFPILRVREIMRWAESGEYERILGGDYLRQEGHALPDFDESVGRSCHKCTAINPKDALFCAECGSNLRGSALVCGACGSTVQPGWRNCPRCGSDLTEAPRVNADPGTGKPV